MKSAYCSIQKLTVITSAFLTTACFADIPKTFNLNPRTTANLTRNISSYNSSASQAIDQLLGDMWTQQGSMSIAVVRVKSTNRVLPRPTDLRDQAPLMETESRDLLVQFDVVETLAGTTLPRAISTREPAWRNGHRPRTAFVQVGDLMVIGYNSKIFPRIVNHDLFPLLRGLNEPIVTDLRTAAEWLKMSNRTAVREEIKNSIIDQSAPETRRMAALVMWSHFNSQLSGNYADNKEYAAIRSILIPLLKQRQLPHALNAKAIRLAWGNFRTEYSHGSDFSELITILMESFEFHPNIQIADEAGVRILEILNSSGTNFPNRSDVEFPSFEAAVIRRAERDRLNNSITQTASDLKRRLINRRTEWECDSQHPSKIIIVGLPNS